MEFISLPEVLELMLHRCPNGKLKAFSCVVCRYDARTDSSGQPIFYENVRLKRHDRAGSAVGSSTNVARGTILKNPNHYKNATRNIVLANGDVRKFHIRDIIIFNNKIVHW